MMEQLKVLSGTLAFEEFTVPDIASYAKVNERTVRTVLDRRKDLFEVIERRPTGRPGGATIVYRIRPEQISGLERHLDELFRSLPAKARHSNVEPDVLPLDVAEEFLTRHFQQTKDIAQRREIIEIAAQQMESVRNEIEERYGEAAPKEVEPAKWRLRLLEAARANCEGVLALQEHLVEFDKMKDVLAWALRDEPQVQAAGRIATPVLTSGQVAMPDYLPALRTDGNLVRAPAAAAVTGWAKEPPGCNVAVVNGTAGPVADSVKSIFSEHRYAHLIDLPLKNPEQATDGDITMFVNGFATGYKTNFAELIFACDSGRYSPDALVSTLRRFAQAVPVRGGIFLVLDSSYDPTLRNYTLSQHAMYAGDADRLDHAALRELLKNQLLQTTCRMVAGLVGPLEPVAAHNT